VGRALRRLPGVVAALGAAVAATGLIWRPSGNPTTVVTPRGQTVHLAGDGLYHYDTVFTAANNTATDAVVLALQVAAGISFAPAEVLGPIAGFAVLGVVGARLLVRLLRALPTTAPTDHEVPDVDVHV
jgi:hypothetical protein